MFFSRYDKSSERESPLFREYLVFITTHEWLKSCIQPLLDLTRGLRKQSKDSKPYLFVQMPPLVQLPKGTVRVRTFFQPPRFTLTYHQRKLLESLGRSGEGNVSIPLSLSVQRGSGIGVIGSLKPCLGDDTIFFYAILG